MDERCEPEIGCFRRDGHYLNPVHRPVNVLPQTRAQVNTKFLLYTRRNPNNPDRIFTNNASSLFHSHFNRRLPTKVLIHGFLYNHVMGKYQQDAFHRLIRAFLTAGDYNVILCDWGDGATTWYFQASANSRTVGREIALLLTFIRRQTRIRMEDFHLVGHSLGAHIAGLAGASLHNLGRITALDPAKPYFEATHPSIRLDPLDALYVDVLHTDASLNGNDMFSLGTRQLMGDVDFFPNDGDRQPSCNDETISNLLEGRGLVATLRHMMTCDHRRSVDLLANYLEESQSRRCIPLAYRCSSWAAYESGQCFKCGVDGQDCAIVGQPKKIRSKATSAGSVIHPFYIKTSVTSPLCAFQYRIEFSLLTNLASSRIRFVIHGSEGDAVGITHARDWFPEQTYAFVVASPHKIQQIQGLRIDASGLINVFGDGRVVANFATITPMNEWSDRVKLTSSVKFCHFTAIARRELHSCS